MKFNKSTLVLCLIALVTGYSSAATVISWNVDHAGTVGGDGTAGVFGDHGTGGAGDFAGVVNAEWWGNSWNGSGQNFNPTNLADNTGTATSLDVTVNTGNNYRASANPGQDADDSWNRNMLTGYQNNDNPPGSNVVMTLEEIPFTEFDVYVYLMSDVDSRVWQITDGTTTFYGGANPASVTGGTSASFNRSTSTTTAGYEIDANYVVFSYAAAAGSSVSYTTTFFDNGTDLNGSFGGVSGFQVVAVPEPTGAIVGGVLMGALFSRRRAGSAGSRA